MRYLVGRQGTRTPYFPAWGSVISGGLKRVESRGAALLTGRRLQVYPMFMLIIGVVFYAASVATGRPPFDVFGRPVAVDLSAHLTGARIILGGDFWELYNVDTQWSVQQSMLGGGHPEFLDLFVSPPFVAAIYAPLAALAYPLAAAVWTVFTIALLIVDLLLIWPLVPNLHRHAFPLVLLVVLSSWPAIELIADGQDSALTLLFLTVGLRALLASRPTMAGSVLGLGAIKPQLFLLIPVFLALQRQWRALGAWVATNVLLGAASIALVSPTGIQSYLALLTSREVDEVAVRPLGFKMLTLLAFCRAVLGSRGAPAASLLAIAFGIVLIALYLGCARHPETRAARVKLIYGMAILAGSLVNPHVFIYDGVVLVLPALLLLDHRPEAPSVRLALAAAYALTWTAALRGTLFRAAPWPLSILAAPWAVLALIWLLLIYHRALSTRVETPVSPAVTVGEISP